MSTHIAAEPGQIAPRVLMPGDPLRAQWIAETFLEGAVCYSRVRNMLGLGASVGYAFRVNPGLRVMPEVAALLPVYERVGGSWTQMREAPNLQFGVAFLMDPVL